MEATRVKHAASLAKVREEMRQVLENQAALIGDRDRLQSRVEELQSEQECTKAKHAVDLAKEREEMRQVLENQAALIEDRDRLEDRFEELQHEQECTKEKHAVDLAKEQEEKEQVLCRLDELQRERINDDGMYDEPEEKFFSLQRQIVSVNANEEGLQTGLALRNAVILGLRDQLTNVAAEKNVRSAILVCLLSKVSELSREIEKLRAGHGVAGTLSFR